MRLKTIQVIAALVAAVCFILAFLAAGIVVLSTLFMAVGLAAIAWLAWSLLRRVRDLRGRARRDAPSPRA
jgi:threonine/homoserine/homoserine lactone efflux protein